MFFDGTLNIYFHWQRQLYNFILQWNLGLTIMAMLLKTIPHPLWITVVVKLNTSVDGAKLKLWGWMVALAPFKKASGEGAGIPHDSFQFTHPTCIVNAYTWGMLYIAGIAARFNFELPWISWRTHSWLPSILQIRGLYTSLQILQYQSCTFHLFYGFISSFWVIFHMQDEPKYVIQDDPVKYEEGVPNLCRANQQTGMSWWSFSGQV